MAAIFIVAVFVFLPHSSDLAGQAEFVIADGQSLGATARLLAERGFISSRYLFVSYAILLGKEKEFQAGRYVIPDPVSIHRLVSIFSGGEAESNDVVITIPEGTNIADIDEIFAKSGLSRAGDIISYNFKSVNLLTQEGFLFPDTYRFEPLEAGQFMPVAEIIKKMRDNFELKTKSTFAGRFFGVSGDRSYRTIIVASILEKEVKTEEDMRLVAGIIENRLELDMPLQIDATVAYGVCYPKLLAGKYCDVSLASIVDNIPVDSEYNTYRRKGLPVGPISNPGLGAIRAALNPKASDYLFYLSAKDGTTIFSRTAAEHESARQKYLK